jgi:hypothetical protein
MIPLPHSYKCDSCLYWKEEPTFRGLGTPDRRTDLGLCRRRPPTVHPSPDGNAYSEWPKTRRDGWCGEGKHLSDVEWRDWYEDDE